MEGGPWEFPDPVTWSCVAAVAAAEWLEDWDVKAVLGVSNEALDIGGQLVYIQLVLQEVQARREAAGLNGLSDLY